VAMKAAARSTRQWLISHGRWGYVVLVVSQLYLGRSLWGKAAAGDPTVLGGLTLGVFIVGGAVWYRIRWTRHSRQVPDGPSPHINAE
jgi:hypothetical protein